MTSQRQNYYFIMTSATTELRDTQIFQQICNVKSVQKRNIFPVFGSKESELLKQFADEHWEFTGRNLLVIAT